MMRRCFRVTIATYDVAVVTRRHAMWNARRKSLNVSHARSALRTLSSKTNTADENDLKVNVLEGKNVTEVKSSKPLWQRVKDEARHYWLGTKLLALDTSTAASLVVRALQGFSLSRRERRQLVRTSTDLLRLVPFAFFVLVPFMEFMIPVVLRFFPNFLPSTYAKDLQKQENMKRQLNARIELAAFLQDTMENYAVEARKGKIEGVNESAEKARRLVYAAKQGWYIPTDDVLHLASLFKDSLTLDSINREQLVAICTYMDLATFGSDAMLRMNIRRVIRGIKADDQSIYWEGIDGMTKNELRDACKERGMRFAGLSRRGYERLMNQWIELSVNKKVPPILLILSGALNITADTDRIEAIEETFINLDDNLIFEALSDNVQAVNKIEEKERRLNAVQHQNEMIEVERQNDLIENHDADVLHDTVSEENKTGLTKAELEAIEVLASDSAVKKEREAIVILQEGEEDIEELLRAPKVEDAKEQTATIVDKQHERMIQLLNTVMDKIEAEVDTVDESIGEELHQLDLDGDGVMSRSELHKAIKTQLKNRLNISDAEAVEFMDTLDLDNDGKVWVSEIEALRKSLQQKEEVEKERNSEMGYDWPDPRQSVRF